MGQCEVFLGCFLEAAGVSTEPISKDAAADFLRALEWALAGRIELARSRDGGRLRQEIDHVVERQREVPLHIIVRQRPTAELAGNL